uniref:(+)-delta-cadinene synthase n=1 Tax=Aquilaria sinensis TaxID=210372 RepID=A0A8E8AQY3_9ROSI|nr:terpene synthase 4 [Aquilaria sinensis]
MSCFSGLASAASGPVPVTVSPGAVKPGNYSRPSADFPPDIWGDHFLAYSSTADLSNESDEMLEHKKLKQEVRNMIVAGIEDPARNLDLVDWIQRLGVSYHFQEEIEELFLKMLGKLDEYVEKHADDLHKISLCFRLLRQQGYKVSSEMFTSFKDDEGNFKESLNEDVEGLLSLYEASHLQIHGEDILEQALSFSVTQLEFIIKDLSTCLLSTRVNHALEYPIRKNFPRLGARFYISTYQDMPSHNQKILKFSKLDFNILQKEHQRELSQISRWWKEMDVKRKFPFARHRIVECYFWILGIYFEPQYAQGREITTKAIALTSILDDIYDAYGTPEELDLLTTAIQGWDSNLGTQLPEYMKTYYLLLLDVYNRIADDLGMQGKSYCVDYVKEEKKKVAKAYNSEAKWYHQNYTPTMEEYMQVALSSSGYPFLSTVSFIGMGKLATRDCYEWVINMPKLILATATISRLQDDIVSHEFEQKRGHSASSVECYMKQYGVTRQEAVEQLSKQVNDAWKDVNVECMHPTAVPMQLLMPLLNLVRVAHVIYNKHDGYTNPHASKDLVASLFLHPIPY